MNDGSPAFVSALPVLPLGLSKNFLIPVHCLYFLPFFSHQMNLILCRQSAAGGCLVQEFNKPLNECHVGRSQGGKRWHDVAVRWRRETAVPHAK
jgi:hypothetical protein